MKLTKLQPPPSQVKIPVVAMLWCLQMGKCIFWNGNIWNGLGTLSFHVSFCSSFFPFTCMYPLEYFLISLVPGICPSQLTWVWHSIWGGCSEAGENLRIMWYTKGNVVHEGPWRSSQKTWVRGWILPLISFAALRSYLLSLGFNCYISKISNMD